MTRIIFMRSSRKCSIYNVHLYNKYAKERKGGGGKGGNKLKAALQNIHIQICTGNNTKIHIKSNDSNKNHKSFALMYTTVALKITNKIQFLGSTKGPKVFPKGPLTGACMTITYKGLLAH